MKDSSTYRIIKIAKTEDNDYISTDRDRKYGAPTCLDIPGGSELYNLGGDSKSSKEYAAMAMKAQKDKQLRKSKVRIETLRDLECTIKV